MWNSAAGKVMCINYEGALIIINAPSTLIIINILIIIINASSHLVELRKKMNLYIFHKFHSYS
jgi:hypothetical protein